STSVREKVVISNNMMISAKKKPMPIIFSILLFQQTPIVFTAPYILFLSFYHSFTYQILNEFLKEFTNAKITPILSDRGYFCSHPIPVFSLTAAFRHSSRRSYLQS